MAPGEAGNTPLLIALMIVGLVSIAIAITASNDGVKENSTRRTQAAQAATQEDKTSMVVTRALFQLPNPTNPGADSDCPTNPAHCPLLVADPYIVVRRPTGSAMPTLAQTNPSSTASPWIFNPTAQTLQVNVPNLGHGSSSNVNSVYTSGTGEGTQPVVLKFTKANYDDSDPYWIRSLDVQAVTNAGYIGGNGNSLSLAQSQKARLAVPAPPPPTCTLTASPNILQPPMFAGQSTTLTLTASGVVESATISDPTNGATYGPITPLTLPNWPNTRVVSQNGVLWSGTVVLGPQVVTATVVSPGNGSGTCSTPITPTPTPTPTPIPSPTPVIIVNGGPSPTPNPQGTPTPLVGPTPTPTPTPVTTPTPVPTPTIVPTPTPLAPPHCDAIVTSPQGPVAQDQLPNDCLTVTMSLSGGTPTTSTINGHATSGNSWQWCNPPVGGPYPFTGFVSNDAGSDQCTTSIVITIPASCGVAISGNSDNGPYTETPYSWDPVHGCCSYLSYGNSTPTMTCENGP